MICTQIVKLKLCTAQHNVWMDCDAPESLLSNSICALHYSPSLPNVLPLFNPHTYKWLPVFTVRSWDFRARKWDKSRRYPVKSMLIQIRPDQINYCSKPHRAFGQTGLSHTNSSLHTSSWTLQVQILMSLPLPSAMLKSTHLNLVLATLRVEGNC